MTGTTHIRVSIELKERIQALQTRGESYADTITRLIDGDNTDITAGVTSGNGEIEARLNRIETDMQHVELVIDGNMLQLIHTKMEELKQAGHSMQEIGEHTGIPEGSLHKLSPGHATPIKRIVKNQYDKLLAS